ncbi:MAG: hypothetical protein LQ350_007967 [Teloschistes chrysophthalmus]|nr:MAG: hypothetical protein LQ350_007967 [Niorma chrysophthalma]
MDYSQSSIPDGSGAEFQNSSQGSGFYQANPGDSVANPITIDPIIPPWYETYFVPPNPQPTPRMIKVFVKNPLGATQEIRCALSDTVSELKRRAALFLGIVPKVVILQRPRQQPLRDPCTLAQYGFEDGTRLELVIIYRNEQSGRKVRISPPQTYAPGPSNQPVGSEPWHAAIGNCDFLSSDFLSSNVLSSDCPFNQQFPDLIDFPLLMDADQFPYNMVIDGAAITATQHDWPLPQASPQQQNPSVPPWQLQGIPDLSQPYINGHYTGHFPPYQGSIPPMPTQQVQDQPEYGDFSGQAGQLE